MRFCHNCERGPGDWCITCRRVDCDDIAVQHGTASGIQMGEGVAAGLPVAADWMPDASGDCGDCLTDAERRVAYEIFDTFKIMTGAEFELVREVISGASIPEAAARLGVARTTAYELWRGIVAKCPAIGRARGDAKSRHVS